MPAEKKKNGSEKKPAGKSFDDRVEDFGSEVEAIGNKVGKEVERAASEIEKQIDGSSAKQLYRSGKNKVLGGVCGGLAEYFNIDPVIVRLIWILTCLVYGAGILLYIIAWIVIPRNPKHKWPG